MAKTVDEDRFRNRCPGFGPTLGKCEETVQPYTLLCPKCEKARKASLEGFRGLNLFGSKSGST